MKRSPKKRGLSKPLPPRKTAAAVRGKTVAVTERAGGETRAKTKVRLDIALVERGLLESREKAARVLLAGDVLVDGQRMDKAGALVAPGARIELVARPRFVSRGGDKLAHALATFAIELRGRVAIDVGASTGGFTHCLLERGAVKVYAVDVGQGQLDAKLRADGRVVVMEKTNARNLPVDSFPESPDLATVDVSFISLEKVLPAVFGVLTSKGEAVVLVKPQFEVGKGQVGKGGVVRDGSHHRAVISRVARFAVLHGWHARGVTASPLKGPKGNREFFLLLTKTGRTLADLDAQIAQVTAEEVPVP
ncbi:MAG TPA: TlyA family RNA methyltransferase [Candidatus Limnocylindria bacterium]|nr:TlyA family RNA methyltransferase [Candidatus Limnocylindria bacterium]